MPPPHPTTEWQSIQDVFYRRNDIYALPWGIDDLADYRIASASNAGLIALVRDPNRLVSVGKAALLKPKILVYTSAGQLVESIPWDPSSRIVGLGFTSSDQLVVVLDEGLVRIYTLCSACPAASASASASTSTDTAPAPIEVTSTAWYTSHALGTDATETGVLNARVYDRGVVVLTGANRFVDWRFPARPEGSGWDIEPALSEPTPLPPADPSPMLSSGPASSDAPPSAWAVLSPTVSSSGLVEVLIARGNTVLQLDALGGCSDVRLSRGPFAAIHPSPNGKFLVLLTADQKIWVVSSDFSRNLSEFDVCASDAYQRSPVVQGAFSSAQVNGSTRGAADAGAGTEGASAPTNKGGLAGTGIRQIEWCGNNAVALAWSGEVLLVGPFGDTLSYPYPSAPHLMGEIDGVRIISADRHEFLQKVPEASQAVFRPGSTDPAAILFDASEHFARRSPRADEGVRAIMSQLGEAVDTCIQASAYEMELWWQRRLLKAASFGKAFLDLYDPSSFVDMARTLRVLNAVRHYEIGIPITYDEYTHTGGDALIARLTARNHHLLSLRLSSYINLRPDPVLKHWARAKIARARPLGAGAGAAADDEICEAIVSKFEKQPAVSYGEIASTAWKAGRVRLATKLLDHEPRAVDQVPLLLSMHEDKLALVKAIESGDTDLVYHVLLRLKSQLSRGDFFRLVQAPISDRAAPTSGISDADPTNAGGEPNLAGHAALAANLLEVYAKEQDRELLRDFYYQDDRRMESAVLALQEAEECQDLTAKVFKMKTAHKFFTEDKERALEAKLTDEQIRLLAFQSALEKEDDNRTSFVGLSLNETIRICIIRNMPRKAEKLRTDWKVPDRRFWSVKVDALVQGRDFEALWAFANSKKSPIGYEPVISRLVSAGHSREALRYVPKCAADKSDKARLVQLIQHTPNQAVARDLSAKLDES